MLTINASDVRKEWSSTCDTVVHDKPVLIKRTRDRMWFSNVDVMLEVLEAYTFTAEKYIEEDGSITLSLNEIDLVENGASEAEARLNLGSAILDYAKEYYEEYDFYSRSKNRKKHIPYVFKALMIDDAQSIGESIKCRNGKI